MQTFFSTTVLTFALACMVLVLPASAAEQRSQLLGNGNGDRNYNLDCGNGGVMVGLAGKWGARIDRMGVLCRAVNNEGKLGGFYTKGPVGGTGGKTSGTRRCTSGEVVGGFFVHTGAFVDHLRVYCYKWDIIKKQRGRPTGHKSIGISYSATGGTGRFFCQGSGFVGKAFRGKFGGYIDRVQVVCDKWNK